MQLYIVSMHACTHPPPAPRDCMCVLLFVMPQEIPQPIPMIRVHVSIDSDISLHPFLSLPRPPPVGNIIHGRRKKGGTYIYFILLRKLGCNISGYHRKINMTNAQLKLANTGHAFRSTVPLLAFTVPSPLSVVEESANVCPNTPPGCTLIFASANTTRANT